jgi:hypothetical protein
LNNNEINILLIDPLQIVHIEIIYILIHQSGLVGLLTSTL